ncbi:MAG: metallophosphoesterase [bacterium]
MASFLEYLVILILRGDLKKLIVIISVFFVIIATSLYICQLPPIITRIDVPIEFLSESLTGFSIVQLSDLHLESRKSKEWLKRIINATNELNPDLIVITGDILNRDRYAPDKFSGILKQLKSKNGIYAVTGNHDHCAGISNLLEFCGNSNIKVLRNEHILINNQIELIGIDYQRRENNSHSRSNLEEALIDCDLTKPSVLLSHAPNHFRKAVDSGIDLQLSGHTHASQVPPIDLIYFLLYRYSYGLYRYKSSSIYTTCGIGTWGPPIRLSSRPEVVLIKLVAKEK